MVENQRQSFEKIGEFLNEVDLFEYVYSNVCRRPIIKYSNEIECKKRCNGEHTYKHIKRIQFFNCKESSCLNTALKKTCIKIEKCPKTMFQLSIARNHSLKSNSHITNDSNNNFANAPSSISPLNMNDENNLDLEFISEMDIADLTSKIDDQPEKCLNNNSQISNLSDNMNKTYDLLSPSSSNTYSSFSYLNSNLSITGEINQTQNIINENSSTISNYLNLTPNQMNVQIPSTVNNNNNNNISLAESSQVNIETNINGLSQPTQFRKMIWKRNDHYTIIYKDKDNLWYEYEYDKREKTHRYKQDSELNDEIIIYDIDRRFFLKMSSKYVYFGHSPEAVNKVFNDGTWIEFILWKSKDGNVLFEKLDDLNWIKKINNIEVERLLFIESYAYHVFLMSLDDISVVFKLSSDNVTKGQNKDDCNLDVYTGGWSSYKTIDNMIQKL